jgi:hypothetical protein
MELLKRSAVVILAKEPLVEWLHSIAELALDEITLEQANDDATVLLIPEMTTMAEVQAYLQAGKVFLLEQELENWTEDREVWPHPLSGKLFDEWFEVRHHTMVWETVEAEDEDDEDEDEWV